MHHFALVSDFDGTITTQDTLQYILDKYATDRWIELEIQWQSGSISTLSCLREQIKLLNKEQLPEMLIDLARTIQISSGFQDVFNYCQFNGIPFYILSDGIEVFIREVLAAHAITLENIFSNNLYVGTHGINPVFPNYNKKHPDCATCKGELIKKIRADHDGKNIIYIGDGRSDRCAVKESDIVFAKDFLSEYCNHENIPYIDYTDFNHILKYLKETQIC